MTPAQSTASLGALILSYSLFMHSSLIPVSKSCSSYAATPSIAQTTGKRNDILPLQRRQLCAALLIKNTARTIWPLSWPHSIAQCDNKLVNTNNVQPKGCDTGNSVHASLPSRRATSLVTTHPPIMGNQDRQGLYACAGRGKFQKLTSSRAHSINPDQLLPRSGPGPQLTALQEALRTYIQQPGCD